MKIGQRRKGIQTALQVLLAIAGMAFVVWVLSRSRAPAPDWGPASPTSPTNNPTPRSPAGAGGGPHRVAPPAAALTPPGRLPTPFPPGAASPFAAPRPVANVLEAQIALARRALSPGPLDGVLGYQTRAALRAFQQQQGLPMTGTLDAATRARLTLDRPPLSTRTITTNDLTRLLPVSPTWLGKSHQPRLDFASLLELVAEEHRAHPELVRRLNPGVDWDRALPGLSVVVPEVPAPEINGRPAFLRIRLQARVLTGHDARTNLLFHFPCSIAARAEKRPVGRLTVVTAAEWPNYTFDPALFPESAEARQLNRKLTLPPGPNNPVGVAWIGLDRPGYGIHGTPRPEDVGRTESHGCFRLANWDAALLLRLVWPGLPVYVEP